ALQDHGRGFQTDEVLLLRTGSGQDFDMRTRDHGSQAADIAEAQLRSDDPKDRALARDGNTRAGQTRGDDRMVEVVREFDRRYLTDRHAEMLDPGLPGSDPVGILEDDCNRRPVRARPLKDQITGDDGGDQWNDPDDREAPMALAHGGLGQIVSIFGVLFGIAHSSFSGSQINFGSKLNV